jgi:hypothetical protein
MVPVKFAVELDIVATVLDGHYQCVVADDWNLCFMAAIAKAYEIIDPPQDGFGVCTQLGERI